MKRIALHGKHGEGRFALVDDEDFEYLNQWNWILGNMGYVIRYNSIFSANNRYETLYIHRVIMAISDKTILIDHIDHDILNNCRLNLRSCTASQNCANMRTNRKNGSVSGFKGVRLQTQINKWVARITVNRKEIHLGCFSDKAVAAEAYDLAAIEHFGEFALTNFPRENYV